MAEGNEQILQFKIDLLHSFPTLIWRRIQVPSNFTFEKLHLAIQMAMGWHNYSHHLHAFYINGKALPDFKLNADDVTESEACLKDYFIVVKQKAQYDYDFTAGWEHMVELESIEPMKPGEKYPKCIAGGGGCPPDGCGGLRKYYELLDYMKQADINDYFDRLENVGYTLPHASHFSPDKVYNNWPSF